MKYLYRFSQILVCLSLFLPLYVSDDFLFIFIAPRNFLFRLLMSLGLGALLILWLNFKDLRPGKSWLNIAVLALLGAKFLSGLLGVNFYNSFWSNYERMEGIIAWLFYVIFYFLLITVFRKREEWKWLFRLSLIPALIVAVYGLGQAFGWEMVRSSQGARIQSYLGNAAFVGAYMVLQSGLAVYVLLKDKIVGWRILAGIGLCLFFLSILYSATRGAMLGWLGAIILGSLIYLILSTTKRARMAIGAICFLLLMLVSGIWIGRDSPVITNFASLHRLTTIRLHEGSVNARLMIWQRAWQGFLERPLLGWGPENFNYVYDKYFDPQVQEEWVDRAHNVFLDLLATGGIATFVPYLLLILFPFYAFWGYRRRDPITSAVFIGLWGGYLIQNLFIFDSLNTYLYFFVISGYALYLLQHASGPESLDFAAMRPIYGPDYNKKMVIVMALVAALLNINLNLPAYKTNRLIIKALKERDPDLACQYFKEAVDVGSFGSREAALKAFMLSTGIRDRLDIANESKARLILFALDALEIAVERQPDDVRLLQALATMYEVAQFVDSGYLDKAEGILKHALEIGPRRVSAWCQLAQVKTAQHNYPEGERLWRTALAIAPRYHKGHAGLLDVLTRQKKRDAALRQAEELQRLFAGQLTVRDKEVLANAYEQFAQSDKAIPFLEPANVKHDKQ